MAKTNYKFILFLVTTGSMILLNNIIRMSYVMLVKLEVINSATLSKDSWGVYLYTTLIVLAIVIEIIKLLINRPSGNVYIIIENSRRKRHNFYVSFAIGIISLILLSYKFEELLFCVAITSLMIALIIIVMMKNEDGIYDDCICWYGREIKLTNILEVKEHRKKVKILVKGKFIFMKYLQDYKLPLNKQEMIKLKNILEAKKLGEDII